MPSPGAHAHTPSLAGGAVITDPATACAVIDLVRARSPDADVVVLLLGIDRRVRAIVTIDGTNGDPDALLTVVEVMAATPATTASPDGGVCDLIVATLRPEPLPLPDDSFRWLSATAIADDAGSELIEWFVISGRWAWCPRDLVGEPPRW